MYRGALGKREAIKKGAQYSIGVSLCEAVIIVDKVIGQGGIRRLAIRTDEFTPGRADRTGSPDGVLIDFEKADGIAIGARDAFGALAGEAWLRCRRAIRGVALRRSGRIIGRGSRGGRHGGTRARGSGFLACRPRAGVATVLTCFASACGRCGVYAQGDRIGDEGHFDGCGLLGRLRCLFCAPAPSCWRLWMRFGSEHLGCEKRWMDVK